MKGFLDLLRRAAQHFMADHAPDIAAAVSYYVLFAIFPLIIGAIIVASFFVDPKAFEQQVFSFLGPQLPLSASTVESTVDAVIKARGPATVIAIVGLLWSGSNIFSAISTAVNRAWGVEKGRGFVIEQVFRLAMLVVAGILLLLSIALTAVVRILTAEPVSLFGIELFHNPVFSSALSLLPVAFNFLIFLLIYKFIPATRVPWRAAAYGAIFAAVLFEIAKYGFAIYVRYFANLNLVYGPLAGVILLLLWAYFSALVLLFGAEFSRTCAGAAEAKPAAVVAPPHEPGAGPAPALEGVMRDVPERRETAGGLAIEDDTRIKNKKVTAILLPLAVVILALIGSLVGIKRIGRRKS